MTERQLRKWMLRDRMNDSWFVSKGGEALDGPQSLSSIFRQTSKAKKKVAIMHASQKRKKDPAWVHLDLGSRMRDADRRKMENKFKRRRQDALVKIIVVVVTALIVALLTINFGGGQVEQEPNNIEAYMTPQERLLNRLAKNDENDVPTTEWQPAIQMALAETEQFFYIKNVNDEPWPTVQLTVNDRFQLQLVNDPIAPDADLAIRKRELIDPQSNQRFYDAGEKLRHVRMVVPGFQELSHRQ